MVRPGEKGGRHQTGTLTPPLHLKCGILSSVLDHQVIKLSAALQSFAPGKEEVENVHGVRREFLDVGDRVRPTELEGAYFIGKMLWPKVP